MLSYPASSGAMEVHHAAPTPSQARLQKSAYTLSPDNVPPIPLIYRIGSTSAAAELGI
jgi:hypothetical protein